MITSRGVKNYLKHRIYLKLGDEEVKMISTTDFRTGLTFELEGDVVQIIEFYMLNQARVLPCALQKS